MPTLTVQARDIKGLTPEISAVNSDETFALSGKNYVFDSRGPKSAFGSLFLNDLPVTPKAGFQVLQIASRTFVCTNESISELQVATQSLVPVLAFEPFQLIARWTHGFLNGVIYFCHPGIGVLYWNQRNGQRGLLQVPGVPDAPIAIVVDNGRLVILDAFTLSWSAQSDGGNFSPALGGAGSQLVSDRVSGDPLMVTSYGRGVLTWTTQGVMRSEFSGGVETYRHRGINTEYRPINSFCVAKLDDETSIILDPRGLFASRGEPPTPFAPSFNEFLIGELRKNDSLEENNVRLEWDPFSRRVFISRAFALNTNLYNQAFVLYVPLQKWGSFDHQHYGYGHGLWLDSNGVVNVLAGTPFMQAREAQGTQGSAHSFDRLRLYPELAQRQRKTFALSSTLRLAALSESQQSGFQVPGLYTFDGSSKVVITKGPLDAVLVVGHFRLLQGFAADELSQTMDIFVGSVESKELSTSDVDYNIVPNGVSDEDYNIVIGSEDFGLNPLSFVNFALRSIGSIDGISAFDVKTPLLSRFAQAMRVYAGGSMGIWHSVELKASIAGEFFHLQMLQLNAVPAGRLL